MLHTHYVSPLYTEGETYRFTSHRSFLCHISFVSVRSVLSVHHAGGQTIDVDPISGYCWPTVYDAEPTLAQYWVTVSYLTPRCTWASVTDGGPTLTLLLFKASCWYYSQHEVGLLTTVEWILASTGDAGPAFTRHWVGVGLHCLTSSPANTRLEPVLVLCWASVADSGPELDQHWVNILCLLGVLTGHICVLHITRTGVKILKLIEPKDDLVTVDHLPGSKS